MRQAIAYQSMIDAAQQDTYHKQAASWTSTEFDFVKLTMLANGGKSIHI
jgi:hypothetical protein